MQSFAERFHWCAPDKVRTIETAKKVTKARKAKAKPSTRDLDRVVAKVRREAKARADAIGRAPDPEGFAKREAAYLKEHPHLAEHQHCGLVPDSDRPTRRVRLPNGIVIHTSWYKVPTTDADATLALREQRWLNEQARKAA